MDPRARADDRVFATDTDEEVARRRDQELVDTNDVGVYLLDSDGQFVGVNDAFVSTTGFSQSELLGEHVSLLLAPDDIERLEREVERQRVSGDAVPLELSLQTNSGETIACIVRVDLLLTDGDFQGTLGVVRRNGEPQQSTDELSQASDGILGTIIDESEGAVLVLDDAFEVVWADPTIGRYFDIDSNSLVGRDIRLVVHELKGSVDDPDRFEKRVLATYDASSDGDFECHVTAGDGREERWLEHWSKPITSGPYAGGRIECFVDVSDRKQFTDALEETEEQFRSLVEAVTEYAIFRLNPDGTVATWNEGAKAIKGYEREEILGEHFSTFYTEEDRAAGVPEKNLERAAETGSIEDEGWRIRQDGSRFWANVTITAVGVEDGRHQGYLKVTRDMTERHKHQQELESELHQIFDRVSDAFFGLDDEFRFTYVNDRAAGLIDVDPEEAIGESIWDLFPAAVGTTFEEKYRRAMREQTPVSFEEFFQPVETWFAVTAYPSETGLSVYFRDVTERRERQQGLRDRERELEEYREYTNEILNTIDDLFYVVDAEGNFRRWNESLRALTGYSDDEIETMAPLEFIVEEDRERLAEAIEEVLETGNSRVEATILTKAGQHVPIEFVASAVETPDGESMIAGIGRDITERKERERELQRIRGRMEFALNATEAVVWDWNVDDDQASFYPSAETLYGTSVENWEDFLEVIHPEDRQKVQEGIEQALETGESKHEEIRIIRDGDVRWIEAPGHPVQDDDGPTRMTGVARDITQRKTYERKLEESNERLEQFAYAASHDLQEPLRMVSSYLQLIEDRYGDTLDEDGQEFIEFAVDGADRMRDMIDGLLAYSRIESDGASFESVDLDDVLADAIDNLRMMCEEHEADISVAALPRVEGDSDQLRQLFQNLLDNAITYSGDGPPRIHVSAEPHGNQWLLSVRDEGVGIDPEDADRIFEVFQSLGGMDAKGSGIGLALCKRIVERHGGDIWVDSTPGEGATFSFTLPAPGDDNE